MPMPMPHKDEADDDFMERCMSDEGMMDEFPDEGQRSAVCKKQMKQNMNSRDSSKWLRSQDAVWLRASGATVGVDRDKRRINGYVVAQLGPFREPNPRGEFDEKSLRQIVTLMKRFPRGVKSRFGHPALSDTGISKHLGRALNPRMDIAMVDGVEIPAVRADLQLADSAFEGNPNGNLGEYLLQRATEDPDSFASSLQLTVDEEWRLDNHSRRRRDADGKEMPPLWRPIAILASDIVDEAAAASSFLSTDFLASLPDAIVRQGCELLDRQFAGRDREFVRQHLERFMARYLSYRYGDDPDETPPVESSEPAADPLMLGLWLATEE